VDRLGDTLRDELSRLGPNAGLAEIVAVWPGVVGDAIARNAWPARISRERILHVATSGAAWAFELTQLAGEIMERLRAKLGDQTPAGLRFAVGRVPAQAADPAALAPQPPPRPTSAEAIEAEALVAAIEDEGLREIVARAARASLARRRGDRSF
jgi:hypothetical protein